MNIPDSAVFEGGSDATPLRDLDLADFPLEPMRVMPEFASHRPVRLLSGLAELSFVAGREGDDEIAWSAEADEALRLAFDVNSSWGDRAMSALRRAFESGRAQRAIDRREADPPASVVEIARAYAIVYCAEVDFPGRDDCPSAIDSEIGRVAYRLAERHTLSPAEAAYAALTAFHATKLAGSLEAAEIALNRAEAGHAERIAAQSRRAARTAECSARAREAVAAMLGGDA